MVILIWKNVARLFQNVLVQPQIIIACLGTLPLLKNQGFVCGGAVDSCNIICCSMTVQLREFKKTPLYRNTLPVPTRRKNWWGYSMKRGIWTAIWPRRYPLQFNHLGWWLSWFFPSNLSFAQRVGWLHHQVQPNFSTTLITVVRQIRVGSAGCNRIKGSPGEEQWVSRGGSCHIQPHHQHTDSFSALACWNDLPYAAF